MSMVSKALRLGAALLAVTLAGAQERPNTLTPKEASAGWILLFDGKSLTGWEPHPTFAALATGDCSVEDGAISCPGTTADWRATAATFPDFVFTLHFSGSEKTNSGVFLRSETTDQPHTP